MGLIHVMEPRLSAMVAAGEVVTRPLNVVKELVENSLDAGAENVIVSLMNGGKRSIEVMDDGRGMVSEDLELCVLSHATSKLNSMEDFMELQSYGFRGEALYSIAAVSRFTIESIHYSQEAGHLLSLHGGKVERTGLSPIRKGTRVCIKDLFFNIPARLKFLKSDQYEKNLIVELMQSFAATRKDVSFELKHNGKRILYTSGRNLDDEVLMAVFGNDSAGRMFPISASRHPILGFEVCGYMGSPDYYRSHSGDIRIFVNSRIVKHRTLMKAVSQAYRDLIPNGKWPVCILEIKIPPRMIDVNVHPMKTEIRLENESLLEEQVLKAVQDSLNRLDLTVSGGREEIPVIQEKPQEEAVPVIEKSLFSSEPQKTLQPVFKPEPSPVRMQPDYSEKESIIKTVTPVRSEVTDSSIQKSTPAPISTPVYNRTYPESKTVEPKVTQLRIKTEFKIVGQVADTIIAVERDHKLLLVDQHVAQERVLFERYRRRLKESGVTQNKRLLIPVNLPLDTGLLKLATEHEPVLQRLGFSFDVLEDAIIIREIPDLFRGEMTKEFLEQLISCFSDGVSGNALEELYDGIAATMACKGSIKAGMQLGELEMRRLISELFEAEHPYRCPHGRPVMVDWELKDIFKKLDRVYKGNADER